MTALLAVLLSALARPSNQHAANAITIYVAYPSGGGYDAYARLLQRHLGRYLTGNDGVLVSNMPGAQGLLCANFMYKAAPNDGSAIAILYQGVGEEQVLATPDVEYDVSKFNWIGRVNSTDELLFVWHSVPAGTVDDLTIRSGVIGHSFLAPPGVPAARVAMLRDAFDQVVKEPQFLEDARRAKMEIDPLDGAPLQQFAEHSVTLDPEALARIRTALVP